MNDYLPYVIALAAGLCGALLAWLASRALIAVPQQDRTYLDRPPLAFRLIWWPIQWVAYYCGPRLSVPYRQRLLGKLRQAGLDYALAPEQFFAARLWLALLLGLLGAWLADSYRLAPLLPALAAAALGFFFPAIWLDDQVKMRRRELFKSLPFYLDIITLCVEGGLNLTGAMQQAVAKGPGGPLREQLQRVLRDVRAGRSRAQALRGLAERANEPALSNLVAALIQAEALGMNLGPVLRAQAEQQRSERFHRAEKLAMEAPVKLLFPLIAFIFPCTFVILGFPIAMQFMAILR